MPPLRFAGAPTSMCTTPRGAACSAPSGADSSLAGGPQNKNGREKQGLSHISPASLASAPLCTHERSSGRARCQTPADVCEHLRLCSTARWPPKRLTRILARARPRCNHQPQKTHKSRTIRAMWDEHKIKQDTNQPPHHVVAQRCATPSRLPSGASAATAASSTAANPAWSQSSCCPCQRSPFFSWQRVPVRTGPSSLRKRLQTLVFWCKSSCGTWMCCHPRTCPVDETCAKTFGFITNLMVGCIVHQKGAPKQTPSPYYDSYES